MQMFTLKTSVAKHINHCALKSCLQKHPPRTSLLAVERVGCPNESERYSGGRKSLVWLNLLNMSKVRGPGKFEGLTMVLLPLY